MTGVRVRVRPAVDDVALSALHAAGFDETPRLRRWSAQLAEHSLSWLDARDGDALVGFVNLAWDGDRHAFLLDLVVADGYRRRGIGRALVAGAVEEATAAGCTWLHADFAPHLTPFHRSCGLPPTDAGLLRLHR
ncbi:GNAT family N-acetyltransferase [Pseudonocardia sp. ICBG1293]|uniref:GNAT family N-acetyltransferase n=1 Tax=Pseudonocardia sp. ICBG1293 TaxID=2844382 RepID=UPI001CCF9125|nr:GNAT family N-acetyltransferase [Pseudonocardia sp. ICBG1293]